MHRRPHRLVYLTFAKPPTPTFSSRAAHHSAPLAARQDFPSRTCPARRCRHPQTHPARFASTAGSSASNNAIPKPPWRRRSTILLLVAGGAVVLYYTVEPFRHGLLAIKRCSVFGAAVVADVIDYKLTLRRDYKTQEAMFDAYNRCHKRSAERVLKALQANGGIYIKLGQHVSAVRLLPIEWTSTMRPLQDQCYPTPFEDVEELFLEDTGKSIQDHFSSFDPTPVGVASLAQVHMAVDRETGRKVAVKLQHPHLKEFAAVDMKTTAVALGWVKTIFPNFEFTWLADEMQENLPLEMDFRHEAMNAQRAASDFRNIKHTTLYIPDVLWANKRTMVMEYIEGARVDDLAFLAKHKIDRNRVSQELSRIFSQMVYINGFFHADPHPGNLLIRPAAPHSRSPFNFEIVLLDHGLYFDLDDELRVNYARLWLTLIAPNSEKTRADRRKYAKLVGNIGPDMYSIFETVITGRAGMSGTENETENTEPNNARSSSRAGSVIDLLPQSEEEMDHMRKALVQKDGLIDALFELLRRVPRRILMVLKLNDLTRNLDLSLATTHGETRIFIIVARYCGLAVWQDELKHIRARWRGARFALSTIPEFVSGWLRYQVVWNGLRVVEAAMDARAGFLRAMAWLANLRKGIDSANQAAAGLAT